MKNFVLNSQNFIKLVIEKIQILIFKVHTFLVMANFANRETNNRDLSDCLKS